MGEELRKEIESVNSKRRKKKKKQQKKSKSQFKKRDGYANSLPAPRLSQEELEELYNNDVKSEMELENQRDDKDKGAYFSITDEEI